MYKIMAAIIRRRLAEHMDETLQNAQYGFRKEKGTADALFNIRRILDMGEATRGGHLF